ncbi:hypothetical protein SRB5_62060 [Streptomyces sp. RB5]|uniref:Mce-associated membrane protein n=1 Tax=Streptomyces smaragdinus TaxID=2585196 RepID=A0A7K0CTG0_9ACTN|nr:hypothetical protein [Streptomyces smaragdinus]MQY16014.1 hypothetical protein [Streptomyces smaragdinus]
MTGRRRIGWITGWTVLAVLVLGSAGLLIRAGQLTGTAAAKNRALTDSAATSTVTGAVSDTLTRIFSYSPKSTDTTEAAAADRLDGKAKKQYTDLFAQVKQRVAEQKLTLTTHVVRAGAVRLEDGEATVLVFLDQVTERTGAEPTSVAAQLSVTAKEHDGQWLITDMKSR